MNPYLFDEMEELTDDQYEAVVVMSKRAKQVLNNRIVEEMISESVDEVEMGVFDEVDEKNPEDYEELEKPTTVAVDEFISGNIKWEENKE